MLRLQPEVQRLAVFFQPGMSVREIEERPGQTAWIRDRSKGPRCLVQAHDRLPGRALGKQRLTLESIESCAEIADRAMAQSTSSLKSVLVLPGRKVTLGAEQFDLDRLLRLVVRAVQLREGHPEPARDDLGRAH